MAAGFSCKQLKAAGVAIEALPPNSFSPLELHSAGFKASALRTYGCTALQLSRLGFGARELQAAGYEAGALLELFDADQVRVHRVR